jgi:hypothetical protein
MNIVMNNKNMNIYELQQHEEEPGRSNTRREGRGKPKGTVGYLQTVCREKDQNLQL